MRVLRSCFEGPRRCSGLLESFAEVLWIDFRLLRTYFRLLETSGTEFWPLGAIWEGSGGWIWLLGASGTGFWPLGRVLEAGFGVRGPSIWGPGVLDLGSGGQGALDLGSGRPNLGSETLLGPLFGGFLRVFLWNGDQI